MPALAEPQKAISSHAGLINFLKGKPLHNDLFLSELTAASTVNGWLSNLSEYRNLVTHICPISQINQHIKVSAKNFLLDQEKEIIGIKINIPLYPGKIRNDRKKNLSDFELLERAETHLTEQLMDHNSVIDMLEYAHSVTNLLTDYTYQIANRAKLDESEMHLTEKDIIRFEKTK